MSKEEWLTSPQYDVSRRNSSEFVIASRTASYFNLSMGDAINNIANTTSLSNRIVSLCSQARERDITNPLGERKLTGDGLELFRGFEYNEKAKFKRNIGGHYRVTEPAPGSFKWEFGNIGERNLKKPKGTTHVLLTLGIVHMDMIGFEKEEFSKMKTMETLVDLADWKTQLDNQELTVSYTDEKTAQLVVFSKLEFRIEVNGEYYELTDQSCNACRIEMIKE